MKKGLVLSTLAFIAATSVNASTVKVHFQNSQGSNIDTAKVYMHTTATGYTQIPSVGNGNYELPGLLDGKTYKIKITCNYSDTLTPAIFTTGSTDPVHDFQLSKLTVHAESGTNNVSGVNVTFFNNSSTWTSMGLTDANGNASWELFGKAVQKVHGQINGTGYDNTITVPASGFAVLNMSLTKLQVPNATMYNGSFWINANGNYVFPGTYTFKFTNPAISIPATVTGATYSQGLCSITFKTSTGTPIAGGQPAVYDWTYGFINTSLTDANGKAYFIGSGNTYTHMVWKDAVQQQHTDFTATPNVDYATTPVTINFKNSTGGDMTGTSLEFWTGNWKTFASGSINGTATMELLPANYYFHLNYKDMVEQQNVTVSGPTTVNFNTEKVVMEIKNNNGDYTHMATGLEFWTGGWKQFGTGKTFNGKDSMELLKGNYYFHLTYKDMTPQINQNVVVGNNLVTFQTRKVFLEVKDVNNNPIKTEGVEVYSGLGWIQFGNGKTGGNGRTSMDLLPGNYYFRTPLNPQINATIIGDTTIAFLPIPCLARMAGDDGVRGGFTSVYPNPATNMINIDALQAGTATIVSLDGKLISTHELTTGTNNVDISTLPIGTYMLISGDNTTKFVKQ